MSHHVYSKDMTSRSSSPVQRCLNMISTVEAMVSTFQSFSAPATNPKATDSKREKQKQRTPRETVYDIIPPLKKAVEAQKSRLSTAVPSHMNIPNIRRFKPPAFGDDLLGPGCYTTKDKTIPIESNLLAVPRLDDRYLHKLQLIRMRRKSNGLEEDHTKITIFDESMSRSPRDYKEKSRINNERNRMVQSVGREIKDYYHEAKKIKLNEKLERIKWLEKKDEILKLKNTWRIFIAQASIASILHLKIKNYKVTDN